MIENEPTWILWHGDDSIVAKGPLRPGETIEVRELRPDEITLTRKEFGAAILRTLEKIDQGHEWSVGLLQRELFGDFKE